MIDDDNDDDDLLMIAASCQFCNSLFEFDEEDDHQCCFLANL